MLGDTFTIEQGDFLPKGKLNYTLKWLGVGRPPDVLGRLNLSENPQGDWILIEISMMEVLMLRVGRGHTILSMTGDGDDDSPLKMGTRYDIEKKANPND